MHCVVEVSRRRRTVPHSSTSARSRELDGMESESEDIEVEVWSR